MSGAPGAVESVVSLFGLCSNAGRWGRDDERGTLNLIDAGAVRRAIATVTKGDVVALGRLLVADGSDGGSSPVRLQVFHSSEDRRDALDTLTISQHGFEVTHLDAVGHSFFEGMAYNGRHAVDIVHAQGLGFGDISAVADGVVTRGILIDIARARGCDHLAATEGISAQHLADAEECGGTEVLAGDAVFIRVGIGSSRPDDCGRRAGLLGSAVQWLHQRGVALYSGDCIERLPGEDDRVPMVLHQVGHVAMGLAILDNPDVERLRAACDRHDRSKFMLVVAPLPIRGGTGSAVNPLALF